MKQYHLLLFATCLLMAESCNERKKISDLDYYGNTFIKMSNDVFDTPKDWNSFVLGDGNFEIQMPPYMRDNSMPHADGSTRQTYLFNYRDTTENRKYHYGRIAIDFIKNDNFKKATEYMPYGDQYDFWEPIVRQALKGSIGKDGFVFPDGKILNGPYYENLYLKCPNASIYVYDAFYRREGHIKGEGPVSVHMFLMMNKQEAAMMTISYHDKDSVLFKDLFNVVKTFKWKEIHQ